MNIKMCMLFIRTEMIQGQKPQKNICPRIEKSILLERVQVGRNRRHDSSVGFRLSLEIEIFEGLYLLRYLPSSFLVVT